jgi:large subunit ribosomal protein L30
MRAAWPSFVRARSRNCGTSRAKVGPVVAKKKAGTFKIKWVVSAIGCPRDMRQTVRGLGLRRLHQVVEREDTPAIRGMVDKVRHLVVVVE